MNEYQYHPTTAVNTSPHLALFLKCGNLKMNYVKKKKESKKERVQWNKGSINKFQEILHQLIDDF